MQKRKYPQNGGKQRDKDLSNTGQYLTDPLKEMHTIKALIRERTIV